MESGPLKTNTERFARHRFITRKGPGNIKYQRMSRGSSNDKEYLRAIWRRSITSRYEWPTNNYQRWGYCHEGEPPTTTSLTFLILS